jgi:hypothetical protein
MRLHAFGPAAAAALVGWSIVAIRRRRLLPKPLPTRPLGLVGVALLAYWLLRLVLSFGLGLEQFPAFPAG